MQATVGRERIIELALLRKLIARDGRKHGEVEATLRAGDIDSRAR